MPPLSDHKISIISGVNNTPLQSSVITQKGANGAFISQSINAVIDAINAANVALETVHEVSIQLGLTDAEIQSSVSDLQTAISDLNNTSTSIISRVESLESFDVVIASSVDSLNGAIATLESSFNTSVDGLSSQITDINSTTTSLDTRITNNTSSISTLNTSVSGLSTTASSLDSRITTNSSAISTNSGNITTLQTSVGTLTTSTTNLQALISTNSTNIATNTNAIATLDGRITGNSSSITNLESSISTTNTNLNALKPKGITGSIQTKSSNGEFVNFDNVYCYTSFGASWLRAGALYIEGNTIGWNISAGGTLSVGGGQNIKKFLYASAALIFGTIANGNIAKATITVAGAAVGDCVSVGLPALPTGVYGLEAYVSAANTVTIPIWNNSGSDQTINASFKVSVTQY